MFGKFKKFAMMFVFCMGIFGVTAFAETSNSPFLAPDGESYKYYLSYKDIKFGYTTHIYSNSRIYLDGKYYKCEGNWFKYDHNYELTFSGTSSTSLLYLATNSSVTDIVLSEYTGEVNPPEIAPTVKQAIAKIIPDLSSQLKILLPVGVILLSTMLGVSLVPRLTRSFL